MRRHKRVFDETFKQQVVREAAVDPATTAEVARRYGIRPSVLYKWCRQYEGGPGVPEEDPRALKMRVIELERMVGRLAMENDFLKKFAAYTKQQTNARSSVITAKTLAASRGGAGWLGLPGARTTTSPEGARPASPKTPNSKSD